MIEMNMKELNVVQFKQKSTIKVMNYKILMKTLIYTKNNKRTRKIKLYRII